MMLGVSGLMSSSGDGAAAAEAHESCGTSGGSSDVGGGNRWSRQETLALIKIRSDMDDAFRDSSLKGPLWQEVSRKMLELGFRRSAKKCKEKFENVFKYHKRTKDGRASKSDGKTYRFSDELTALENPPPPSMPLSSLIPTRHIIVSSTALNPINSPPFQPPSSSSSTSSDEDIQRRQGKKRKWKDFFNRLMKDVIHKQEELQRKFLDSLQKRERDRMAREEAWRVQEVARMNREHEILVQERSIAAAKDAAVIAFLQKATEQNNLQIPVSSNIASPPPQPPDNPQPPPKQVTPADNGGGNNAMPASSSRWPKVEIQALINLRTSLDLKYQESGPKSPLWEEISAAMAKLGYNRSSKRCKEKWENINKYFKKVKESSKKRPEDSKTCPYFHQLDAIYREKAAAFNVPIMARPEQQWPQQPDQAMPKQDKENESENDDEEDEDEGGGRISSHLLRFERERREV